ncbi:MAG: dethiobiotin synthase [bacterium]|nr:dethiobiotin synthase [bacterium]
MKGLFITGTNTDIGKTVVTTGLLHCFRENGVNAISVKPVQTGGEWVSGKLTAPDLNFLRKFVNIDISFQESVLMNPYCYEPACSPHLAGKLSDNFPNIQHIIKSLQLMSKTRDFILVEGAGGIMVPLNMDHLMLDLMKAVNFPVVLVAGTGLGTINHTMLSINVLKSNGLKIAGIIFCNTKPIKEEDRFIIEDNIKTIEHFTKVNILGVIDYIEDIENRHEEFKNVFEKQFLNNKIMEEVK